MFQIGDQVRIVDIESSRFLQTGKAMTVHGLEKLVFVELESGSSFWYLFEQIEKVEGIIHTFKLSDEERLDIVCALSEYLQFLTGREDSDGATDEERQRISKLITRFDKYGF